MLTTHQTAGSGFFAVALGAAFQVGIFTGHPNLSIVGGLLAIMGTVMYFGAVIGSHRLRQPQ